MNFLHDRRVFLKSAAAGAAVLRSGTAFGAEKAKKRNIPLGFDNFSVRAMGWKAPQLLDYAASLKVDVLMLSDLDVYESLEEDYLKGIKKKADNLGILIHAGTGGVCPTSKRAITKFGSSEEHLALAIKTAKILGSPVIRCYLGSMEDRKGEGGIYPHIDSTAAVFKKVKNLAVDANVKIAIENHAGDMQAWELAGLVETAGKDFVGVTMDCGNAAWIIEDPMLNLEILGPYAASTGLRDNAVWESENGANVVWANIGEGNIDWEAYVNRFAQLCPGVPFVLEIISQVYPRTMNYLEDSFWDVYPKARASEFAKFVRFAKKGKPYTPPPGRPEGPDSKELAQKQQKFDLERSLQYCKNVLGLGLK
ncbi:MAG: TIM barrel protein [Candidatus Omnitrophota bacterium]